MKTNQTILFYDGLCPLCTREISLLRQLAAEQIDFVDIHHYSGSPEIPSRATLLKRLHVRHNNQWLTGLDATLVAWSMTRFGWLLAWLRWPVVKPIADKLYTRWADKRYQQRYQCGPCMGAED